MASAEGMSSKLTRYAGRETSCLSFMALGDVYGEVNIFRYGSVSSYKTREGDRNKRVSFLGIIFEYYRAKR